MRDNRAWLLVADQTSDAQATNVKIILLCDSLLGKTNCSNQAWLLKNSFLVPNSRNLGDKKCLADPTKSIAGLRDAIFICANFTGRSFSTATGDCTNYSHLRRRFFDNNGLVEVVEWRYLSSAS